MKHLLRILCLVALASSFAVTDQVKEAVQNDWSGLLAALSGVFVVVLGIGAGLLAEIVQER